MCVRVCVCLGNVCVSVCILGGMYVCRGCLACVYLAGMYVCRGCLSCVYLGMCVCVWVGDVDVCFFGMCVCVRVGERGFFLMCVWGVGVGRVGG